MTPLLIEIYTIYGASFIALGTVALMLPRAADDLWIARHIRWLAAFALLFAAAQFIGLMGFTQSSLGWHGGLMPRTAAGSASPP